MLDLRETGLLAAWLASPNGSEEERFEKLLASLKVPESRRPEFQQEWNYLAELMRQNPGATVTIPAD